MRDAGVPPPHPRWAASARTAARREGGINERLSARGLDAPRARRGGAKTARHAYGNC